MGSKSFKIGLYPFLYLVFFLIFQYSINDMATSTNAYQAQGNRLMVYVYLVAILVVLGVYFFSICTIRMIVPIKMVILMTIWVTLDNFFLGNFFNGSMWTCFTHIGLSVWWILAIVFGYYYPGNNSNKYKQVVFFAFVMFVYYVYQFVSVAVISNETHDETTVLNLIYRVIVFVPFIFLMTIEKRKLRSVLLIAIFIMTIASMKRGAIVVLPIMLLSAYIFERKDERISNNIFLKKAIRFLLIMVGIIILLIIFNKLTNGFLAERFSLESLMYGSSRSEKYATAINEITQRNFLDLITGVGSGARGGIHNEILEFLYTFGVVGLILYFGLIISMVRRLLRLKKANSRFASIYATLVVYIFVVGLYSGVYFTHQTFYIMLTIGMVERKIFEEEVCQQLV